jgi:uncharacterized damage-inducible protein DinB
MIQIPMLLELFQHNDWAREKLLDRAAELTEAQLDHPFEIGPGSVRQALWHIYGAERIWIERIRLPGFENLPPRSSAVLSAAGLAAAARSLAQSRREWLEGRPAPDLQRVARYQDAKGNPGAHPVGHILLHVCNHGIHHRAQAVNMLRSLGQSSPLPRVDYLFMKLEQAGWSPDNDATDWTAAAAPGLDAASLAAYRAYSDWAFAQVCTAASRLSAAQLDQRFEIVSLAHISQAEQWWLQNWTHDSPQPFPPVREDQSIAELSQQFSQSAAAREQFLAGLSDADLQRSTTASPRVGVRMTFAIGTTMLQLCCHGAHHRAQVLNLLRRLGAAVPALDYLAMLRQQQSG